MRRNSRKINRSLRTVVEQLESRTLLSAWAGTWKIQGLMLDAEQSYPTGQVTQKTTTITARITDGAVPGQYIIDVSGPVSDHMIATGDDTQLTMNLSDTADESYLRMLMVDPGVAAVTHVSVEYTDDRRESIDYLNFFGGIATRKAAPVIKFAWDGEYAFHSSSFELNTDGGAISTNWSSNDVQVIAEPIGGGQYSIGEVGDSDRSIFSPSGAALVSAFSGTSSPNTYERQYDQVVRGPYGRIYHAGAGADFDSSTGQFLSAWFDAGYSEPHVNIAPTLNTSGSPYLNAMDEDALTDAGTTISTLLAHGGSNYIYDPNASDPQGIALVGADTKHGKWQYSLDDGDTWADTGKVNAASALLLPDTATLRFVPKANYFGKLAKAISFRAWDQSAGTPGGRASVNASAGTSAFSKGLDTASLEVSPVNDAPVLTPGSDPLTYRAGAKPISIFSGMKLSDVDSKYITSATVTLTGGYDPTSDVITYRGPKTISAAIDSASGTIQLTSATPLKLATYQAAIKGIFFSSNSRHGDVTMTFNVVDEDAAQAHDMSTSLDRLLEIA